MPYNIKHIAEAEAESESESVYVTDIPAHISFITKLIFLLFD